MLTTQHHSHLRHPKLRGLPLGIKRGGGALYLGAIPVVERTGGGWDDVFLDLPVLLVNDFGDVTQELLEASYPRLLARCGAFDYRKLTKAYWFWEMRRDDRARAGPPPDGEDLPPAVRVAFRRGPGRRFSGRGAEAGLAKLPQFLVDRLPAPTRPLT